MLSSHSSTSKAIHSAQAAAAIYITILSFFSFFSLFLLPYSQRDHRTSFPPALWMWRCSVVYSRKLQVIFSSAITFFFESPRHPRPQPHTWCLVISRDLDTFPSIVFVSVSGWRETCIYLCMCLCIRGTSALGIRPPIPNISPQKKKPAMSTSTSTRIEGRG